MNVIPAIPHILRESSRGIDAVSVYDEMLERRELVLLGEVEPSMAQLACQCVRHLERLDPAAPITVFVESPGGEVHAGLALFDVLRSVSCPVRTVCTSTAASMGAVIFMAGDERAMYPHAELMVQRDPVRASELRRSLVARPFAALWASGALCDHGRRMAVASGSRPTSELERRLRMV